MCVCDVGGGQRGGLSFYALYMRNVCVSLYVWVCVGMCVHVWVCMGLGGYGWMYGFICLRCPSRRASMQCSKRQHLAHSLTRRLRVDELRVASIIHAHGTGKATDVNFKDADTVCSRYAVGMQQYAVCRGLQVHKRVERRICDGDI